MNSAHKKHAESIIAGSSFARAEFTTICGELHIQVFTRDPRHEWAMPDGTILALSAPAGDLKPLLAKHSRQIEPLRSDDTLPR